MAEDVADDARVLSSLRGVSSAELLSDILQAVVKKALADEMRKRLEGQK